MEAKRHVCFPGFFPAVNVLISFMGGIDNLDKNTYLSEVMWRESLKIPQILQDYYLIGEDGKLVRLDQKLGSILKPGDTKCVLNLAKAVRIFRYISHQSSLT